MTAIIEWVDEATIKELKEKFHDFKFHINYEFPVTANIEIPITKNLIVVVKCDIQDSSMAWGKDAE